MTGISLTGPNETEVTCEVEQPDEREDEGSFYVEKSTNLIFQVRFFPDFALLRPAHPDHLGELERMDLLTFTKNFDEFYGDQKSIHDFLWGGSLDSIEISRKN